MAIGQETWLFGKLNKRRINIKQGEILFSIFIIFKVMLPTKKFICQHRFLYMISEWNVNKSMDKHCTFSLQSRSWFSVIQNISSQLHLYGVIRIKCKDDASDAHKLLKDSITKMFYFSLTWLSTNRFFYYKCLKIQIKWNITSWLKLVLFSAQLQEQECLIWILTLTIYIDKRNHIKHLTL